MTPAGIEPATFRAVCEISIKKTAGELIIIWRHKDKIYLSDKQGKI